MRNVAISSDFVRCIYDDHSLVEVISYDARNFTQHRCLADSWSAKQQDALPGAHEVIDDANCPIHGATDPTCKAHNATAAVTNAGDAVKRSFDARAVVLADVAQTRDNVLYVSITHFRGAQFLFALEESRFRRASKIHYHFEQFPCLLVRPKR
jgi:hypothetical protein